MYVYDEYDQKMVDERVAQYRDQTNRFLADTAGFDFLMPASEQRDAVPILSDIYLVSPPGAIGSVIPLIVPLLGFIGKVMRFLFIRFTVHEGSIVAGIDHKGVVGDTRIIHSFHHLPHRPINLHHEVPVRSKLGLPLEPGMR